MENSSTWTPRPAKVLRSFYRKTLEGQYGGLGPDFVAAAVELALLMADMPYWAIDAWLKAGLEHQLLETNHFLATEVLQQCSTEERSAALAAHYESSYVSMIMSLNNMNRALAVKDMIGQQKAKRTSGGADAPSGAGFGVHAWPAVVAEASHRVRVEGWVLAAAMAAVGMGVPSCDSGWRWACCDRREGGIGIEIGMEMFVVTVVVVVVVVVVVGLVTDERRVGRSAVGAAI
ncbi:hypothetical protein GJ744_002383 [Endocarpon pusillum]|uniref:Uncharacterized protein n=1 Tax=Endocarpon pusillum TaxID=364733 RepID=A0A8H7AS73_9EURO|nr:hypothetical protein GJ744_002383 [Endocarpon pusillum]